MLGEVRKGRPVGCSVVSNKPKSGEDGKKKIESSKRRWVWSTMGVWVMGGWGGPEGLTQRGGRGKETDWSNSAPLSGGCRKRRGCRGKKSFGDGDGWSTRNPWR